MKTLWGISGFAYSPLPHFTAFKKAQVSHVVQQILTPGKPCIMDTGVGGMGKNCSLYKYKHSSSKDTDLKPFAAQKTYYTQQKC